MQKLLADIENGTINTLEQVTAGFSSMHENYPAYELAWAVDVLQQRHAKTKDEITAGDIIELTKKWKEAVVGLDRRLYADAKKEFAAIAQIGYGLDGEEQTRHSDFDSVRGTFEEDSFVSEIEKHIFSKTELGDELISRMEEFR